MYKIYTKTVCTPPGYIKKILLVMKLTTLILFAALMQVSAAGLAQRLTLVEKNATLKEVFNEINKQTNYNILWSSSQVNGDIKVDADFKDTPLLEVLDKCLENTDLTYSIENKNVVIKHKEPTLLDRAKAYFDQVTVTGKVTNELGDPMPNVNVKEKGTSNGTTTDKKGLYTLKVAGDKSLITFTYIGYESQELQTKDLPDGAVIVLKPAPQNLQEVIINKGYYSEKQELTTGDVSIVDAKTIEEQPVSDPIQALIGRVPGLNIQQTSGNNGSYATIHINGLNSIANGNDPLYVIDGVPFSSMSLGSSAIGTTAIAGPNGGANFNANGGGISPFSALNPDDIESIEVLKDADATAIYGSRGGNGVIIITTKKGKAGDTKFNLNASQGAGSVGHFMNLLNTQQYLQVRHQAYANDGLPFPSIATNPYDNNYDVDGVWDTTRNTNWQKALIGGTAQWTNIQGTLSGGNANTQFLIGGGYNRNTTVYPGDYVDRKASVHVSITHASNNQKFHLTLSASYVNDNNVLPTADLTQEALTLAPDAPPLYNPNGSINWQLYNGSSTFGNPLAPALQSSTAATNNLISNLDMSYLLLPGLTLKSDFGYNHDEMNENYIIPSSSEAPPYNTNPYDRNYDYANTVSQTWNIEPQLSYEKKIAKGTFNALLGATFQQSQQQSLTNYAVGFANDALITDPLAASITGIEGDTYSLYRYNAVYGRLGYNWKEKYLLNVTVRRDGSSRFGPDKEFGNFGSIGAGWIFSKEKFATDNLPWLSFGKFRGSYGITGNDQIANYGYLSTYYANSTTYQGITQLLPSGIANPNYSWEIDKKLEGGLDLGFLKDRINLSLSYYRNRTNNQLVGYPLPTLAGFTSYQYNLPATVQNTGLEATLNTVNIKENDFSWTTNVNFTLPQNKLISFPGLAGTGFANGYVVGQPLYIRRVWDYTGVNPQTGLYTFATSNPSGNLTVPQDYINEVPTQKFYGGMQNSFTYKNFSLDVFFQFVKQLAYSYQYYFNNFPGATNSNEPTAVLNAWQAPGQLTTVEKFTTGNVNFPNQYEYFQRSTGVFTDASFIRLKNVSLSYRLPASWQQWAGMQNAKVFIQGQNLYTLTKYIGLDPETGDGGLPPLRMITGGLSATF
jgi:TonB-linked SusC/RagA family outer membrane protein